MHPNSKTVRATKRTQHLIRNRLKLSVISLLFVSASFYAIGCGGSYSGGNTSSPSSFSCIAPGDEQCTDYGSGYTVVTAQSNCGSGTFSSTSNCVTTNRVGICQNINNNLTVVISYYSPLTVSMAQADCGSLAGTNSFTGT